jgi:hypothetical protein
VLLGDLLLIAPLHHLLKFGTLYSGWHVPSCKMSAASVGVAMEISSPATACDRVG